MQPIAQDLTARIEKLERETRAWRRVGLAAVGLAGVALLASMTSAVCRTVNAERFVLQDGRGRERARITAYETGGAPLLSLLDAQGKPQLSFGLSESGQAYVELQGEKGACRSRVSVSPEGQATLTPVEGDASVSMLGR